MSSKEELYKVLVESVPYGTLFFAYGVCVDANKHALELLGFGLTRWWVLRWIILPVRSRLLW